MLVHLHANEGQEIFAVESPTGYTITKVDSRVQEQVKVGKVFMDRYQDVFAALAT